MTLGTEIKRKSDSTLLQVEVVDSPPSVISSSKAYIMQSSHNSNSSMYEVCVAGSKVGVLSLKFEESETYIGYIANTDDEFSRTGQAMVEFAARITTTIPNSDHKISLDIMSKGDEDPTGFYMKMGFRKDGDEDSTRMVLDCHKEPTTPDSPRRIREVIS